MPAAADPGPVLTGQGLAARLARTRGVARLDTALWRSVAAARGASLLYALVSGLIGLGSFRRPGVAVAVLVAMVLWSVVVTGLITGSRQPSGIGSSPTTRAGGASAPLDLVLAVDLAVASTALLLGRLVQSAAAIDQGQPSLTLAWGVIPVLAWGVWRGPWAAGAAGTVLGVATVLWRGELTRATVGSVVLILLVGVGVGYVASLARRAERAYAKAVHEAARQAERDRLARTVHDGVLQALALVSRQSSDPRLASLAGEQERALRSLVAGPGVVPVGEHDLRALLPVASDVSVSAPAFPVLLPAPAAVELAAAVAACIDNVRRHAGGTAWVLVEAEPGEVVVTVRDEGPGVSSDRLEVASGEGRLGFAQSVRGRVGDLGGSVSVVSEPGHGTEVELRVPARPSPV